MKSAFEAPSFTSTRNKINYMFKDCSIMCSNCNDPSMSTSRLFKEVSHLNMTHEEDEIYKSNTNPSIVDNTTESKHT